jgi:DNA-binding MurR/RpiR family transcriptional regulator
MKQNETQFLDPLTAKQRKAIAALIEHPSIDEAAESCGISRPTIWRWLQNADFRREYQQAQRQVVEAAISELQAATSKAVRRLVRNLESENDFAANQAAISILSQSLKALELRDLIARVEELEGRLKPQGVKRA